jgi:serine/threonine protein phosphatase PrpC
MSLAHARSVPDAPAPLPACSLRAAVRSDAGAVRTHNEDAAYVDTDGGLFMVADGIGGQAAGEVASAIAIEVVRLALHELRAELDALAEADEHARHVGVASVVGDAVRGAHEAIQHVALCEDDKRGMGTTLDVVLIVGDEAFIAHVGDTRTYLIRNGEARQLTRDHTMAALLAQHGVAAGPRLRPLLLNAVGIGEGVTVDVTSVRLEPGDQLLIASDGLHEYVAAGELAERASWDDPDLGIRELVDVALGRGGHDNLTGVLVVVVGVVGRAGGDDISDGVPALAAGDAFVTRRSQA